MKISIITVVYNNAESIEDCIKSVISQTYNDIEYIIIDGESSDGTIKIIDRHRAGIAKFISEKDESYVHAMNKGIGLATGDVVGFLHSDDLYANDKVIERIADVFRYRGELDSLYGNLIYISKNNPDRIIRYWDAGEFSDEKITRGWMPPHPTFFVKRQIYERHGSFDTGFKIAADYEIMLRFLLRYRISAFYLPEVLVKMRLGGVSNRNFASIVRKSLEDYRACRIYGLGLRTLIMKNVRKAPQFIGAFNKGTS